jgi:hypothetical protein
MFFILDLAYSVRRLPTQKLSSTSRPRGIAVVMVLGLLAITIAVSYATLRGQGTTTQLARNNSRALDARAASRSGIAAAIRKMSENSWGGITSTVESGVTSNSSYQVKFKTGDDSLTPASLDYNERPFRVMIDSTGFATDPLNPQIQSQFKSRCVVQLLRKRILSEPAGWSTLMASNVYQFSNQDAYVQFPVRMNGRVTLLGKLRFCTEYPASYLGSYAALDKYLLGLQLRSATLGDYRPFPLGNLYLKDLLTVQDSTTRLQYLTVDLGTPALEPVLTASPPSHPGSILQYRLYPGGEPYDVELLQSPLSGKTIAPRVIENPLGIYRTSGTLTIGSNVQLTGTIISENSGSAEIQITGTTNVVLQPNNLPALYGTSQTYQLPTLISKSNVVINKATDVQLNGTTVCWKTFEVWNNDPIATNIATKLSVTGSLVTDTFIQHGRSTWTQTPLQWFVDQLAYSGQSAIPYFPDWEQASSHAFTVKPTLTFSPDSSGVNPHWHDWSQAVYQPDPADPGLKWEVIRWEENLPLP